MLRFVLIVFLQSAFLLAAAIAAERPNVVVVMTDDQGYGEFSCNGNPITRTPSIDKLASEAVRLTDFHVAPMCTPTRGQLMTGLDAFANRAINVSSGRTLLKADLKTIADVFRGAGYRTGLFGKWHLGDNYPFCPEDRGFDEAIWFPSSHINSVPDYWDNDYFDDTYIHNGKRQRYSGYCTDVFFDEAARWMGERSDQPFFTYIATNSAHWPWFVPDHYRQPVRDAIAANEDIVKHLDASKREDLVSFLAMGANIDDNVGKLDAFLSANGLMDNTIVVFLTDNGSTMGQDYFNAGMRGKKTQLWEGGHRVPCFIRWPDGDFKVRDVATLSHVQDLMPTLADLASVNDVPRDLDGVSLASVLRGETDSVGDRKLVINYSRMPLAEQKVGGVDMTVPQRDGAGVLWRRWRLLENKRLYNIDADPHQDHDVAVEHPDVVAEMRSHLQSWWDDVKIDVATPERVVIGNDAENPMLLTACEWLDVFVDQQVQVRRATQKNGVWHLIVDRPGTYTFTLRRYPSEADAKLDASMPPIDVTDGTFIAANSLPIASARMTIESQTMTGQPNDKGTAVEFTTTLDAGPTELQTWFVDENGNDICGAYFVEVRRS